jgi:hypothetical protein
VDFDGDRLVSAKRRVTPAFTLYSTCRYALEKAQRTDEGSFLELLTANLMAALTFEAYLNQAGVHLWGSDSAVWAAVERLSPMAKLKAIAEQSGFSLDLGARPAQTVAELCQFRNAVAHGKPEFLEAEIPARVAAQGLSFPQAEALVTPWERICTPEFVTRALGDLEELTDALAAHIGMLNPLHVGGLSEWDG